MTLKQIAVIHPYFNSLGGSEKVSHEILKLLDNSGYSVNLYTIDKVKPIGNENVCFVRGKNDSNLFPFMIYLRNKLPSKIKKIIWEKKLFATAKDENISIVTSGNLLRINGNKRIIVYCNSAFKSELDYVYKKYKFPRRIYESFYQKEIRKRLWLLENTNQEIITNSWYTHDSIKKDFGLDSKIIYPPVDLDFFLSRYNTEKHNKIAIISRISSEKKLLESVSLIKKTGFNADIMCSTSTKEQELLYGKILDISNIRKGSKQFRFYANGDFRKEVLLSTSKVYLQNSVETFGIAVVEAIASGCIPIVPNNSANIETVPFPELRFNDDSECIKILSKAMNGDLDKFKPLLLRHIQKFSLENFRKSFLDILSNQKS